jgi:hypothetical protein
MQIKTLVISMLYIEHINQFNTLVAMIKIPLFLLNLACKQTLRERTSAVKHPLHKLIKIPRHSPLIKYQITKLCKISNRKEVDTMISQ